MSKPDEIDRILDDYRMSTHAVSRGNSLTMTHDEAKAAIEAHYAEVITNARIDELLEAFRELNKGDFQGKLRYYDNRLCELKKKG